MTIRLLPDTLVNQIAAGEVVERPASAVKELVENALDADATRIDVVLQDGGRTLIQVSDDGRGMTREELELAVQRHATSKLPDDDLVHIETLGFRGEALPSIGAVSRLTLTSRAEGAAEAWTLSVEGGTVAPIQPAAHPKGTRIEVRDLFFATPARLKFLKAARTELSHAADVIKRLAMAHPEVGFTLSDGNRSVIKLNPAQGDLFAARLDRLGGVMGREFSDNAMLISAEREGISLGGYAGLPTLSRGNSALQFLFVNGRPVRDKLLYGALRGAYQDVLAGDRYPLVALFLDLPPEQVDVNVHPAKTEVRFRDAGLVRGLIVGAIKHALAEAGHRTATTAGEAALGAARPQGMSPLPHSGHPRNPAYAPSAPPRVSTGAAEAAARFHAPLPGLETAPEARAPAPVAEEEPAEAYPLGVARAQLHATYIVAQTADGIVIVDQHAAHERLVHERLKKALEEGGVARQGLLIPEVVELDEGSATRLLERAEELEGLGLLIEAFGPGAVVVRETPALLGECDAKGLVRDLADDLAEMEQAVSLKDRLSEVCATLACHGSVRAGRQLNGAEMNALLREMEGTALSGQCSHGRPTYVELKLHDIEKLFGRR